MTMAPTTAPSQDNTEIQDVGHVDVLIVGAGVSGIGVAHHLRERFPDRTFAILDAQDNRGGTWWTHRYPGVRSDSDLFTYGYRFKPWRGPSIAAGGEILAYLDEVIDEDDLARHIHYQHRVTAASWSTADRRWTVEVARADTGQRLRYTTSFLWMCQGYYNHARPYKPQWEGMDRFQGLIVHPQQWPDDLDLTGKRVVVIGSGATAATLIPAIAEQAEHVTMLQRSPTYYFAAPTTDELAVTLRGLDVPEEWTYEILRRQHVALLHQLSQMSFDAPDQLHAFLMESIRPLLPEGFDVDKHLTPRYRPWQQRIAIVPDGDLFASLRAGKASIATDTIDTFTEHGIRVSSGEEIPADIVVSATGFNLSLFGDVAFAVDDEPVDFTEHVTWRGIMISDVPNMAYVFGYFRHSWTLRVDLVADLVLRLLANMRDKDATMVVPALRPEEQDMPLRPWANPDDFNAGYVMRTQHLLYKQGDREPWTHLLEHQEERDTLPKTDLDDGTLIYSVLVVNGRPRGVDASAREGPADNPGLGLFDPPAWCLLGLVVPAAFRAEVALVGGAVRVGDGVVQVAVESPGVAARSVARGGAGAYEVGEPPAGGVAGLGGSVVAAAFDDGFQGEVQAAQEGGELGRLRGRWCSLAGLRAIMFPGCPGMAPG
ncbi:MAG TPA: NAD(P)/FAD-dependent oxidoreductase [Trebonia sp.]|nr:NAD(P)/FAD-dependent oxidoreductase [Trebonia sp.]